MGTFTISYFLRTYFLKRPKWHYAVFIPSVYLAYRYHFYKRHRQMTAMKGRTNMYKSRREEILRWDPHADIWYY